MGRPRPVRGRPAPDRAAGGPGRHGHPGALRPLGAGPVRALDTRIGQATFDDPVRRELAGHWRARRDQIAGAVDRAERLGRVVAAARPRLVACHADLHTANLLVVDQDRLAVVDWDGLRLAPPERDLMFVAGQAPFFAGYGPVRLDRTALAYYRWEWAVQELADYGGRLFDDRLGEAARRQAVAGFRGLFGPGDVVEAAREADRGLGVS